MYLQLFLKLLVCVQYVPDHRNKGSLYVCVDVRPLAGHGSPFISAYLLLLSPFPDGFTVLSVAYFFFGDCIVGELESDNYFNGQTCPASLVRGTGVGWLFSKGSEKCSQQQKGAAVEWGRSRGDSHIS